MVELDLCKRPTDQISTGSGKWVAAGWVWFRCQKEKQRKINGLSDRSAFLRFPPSCQSRRVPLTERGLPGTGRVIFLKASTLIGLAYPVEGSLSDGEPLLGLFKQLPHSWPCLEQVSGGRLQMKRS